MPPKRTRNKSPSSPTRKVPTRNAKTRSAASTASMYKNAEAYLESASDEYSDQISDPEDAVSESDTIGVSDTNNEDEYDDEDEDIFDKPAKTRSRRTQRATEPSSTSSKAGGASNRKAPATEKGKGRVQRTSPTTTSTGATRKAAPPSKPTPPPKVAPPATTAAKRKASQVRFVPLVSSPASSSSSRTTAATSTASSPSIHTKANPETSDQNQRSDQWTEKYAPSDIEEVAVHHGKIASVREWLETYTDPSNRQQDVSGGAILVLSGPAGSGKTTVLKMLAQEIDLTIVEWANSVNENNVVQRPVMPGEDSWRATSIDEEYIPVMRTFQEFFSRAQRFNPILTSRDLSQSSQSTGAQAGFSASMSASGRKNVILIEDLPPITAVSSRKIFQETIAKFANSRISSSSVLVLIVSDVFTKQSTELLFSNTNENRDPAMTIRVLLPSTVLDKIDSGGRGCARVKQIKFNPIAPTIMTKAIRKLINKEFKASHAHAPDTAEIEQAIKMHDGDIRAVINSLQFLCYIPAKKRKRYREAAILQEENQKNVHDSENKITQGQDSSLGVFHAVAKVLYNRRDWKAPHVEFDSDIVKVPPQAWTMRRPPLPFNPDKDLIEKLPIEPDLYTLMLYQNYTRHMHTIEECHTAMEYLCIADRFSHSSGSSANYTQMIQMQPYMTSLAVRGLLFAPTSASPTSNVGGAKKHWWPELFAVNRIMHANDEMFLEVAVDLLGEEAKGLSAGHVTGPGLFPKRVVREELVPMLHKCMRMNPYMPIFSKSLRPSSKAFVRDGAGNYGRKTGVIKKEFGEGDEGFLEDVTDTSPSAEAGVVDEIVDESMEKIGTGSGWDSRVKQDQQKKQRDQLTYEVEHDEDPIEDFSE